MSFITMPSQTAKSLIHSGDHCSIYAIFRLSSHPSTPTNDWKKNAHHNFWQLLNVFLFLWHVWFRCFVNYLLFSYLWQLLFYKCLFNWDTSASYVTKPVHKIAERNVWSKIIVYNLESDILLFIEILVNTSVTSMIMIPN